MKKIRVDSEVNEEFSKLRKEYTLEKLSEESASSDAFVQFQKWYQEAVVAKITEPNAFVLATASSSGKPSARTLLLKSFSPAGFVFYTNYLSKKGLDLEVNPYAAMLFYWPVLERQVRIEGLVVKLPSEESDRYFQSRPRGAQLGAVASRQSSLVRSRVELEQTFTEIELKFKDSEIPRPEYWGGYLVSPELFEFWQGRKNRLHDRLEYRKAGAVWNVGRLAP